MKLCPKCMHELPFASRIVRSDECPACLAPLHSCTSCRFHDPGAHNECREIGTEPVRDRDAANYCDMFMFLGGAPHAPGNDADSAKKKLESLFNL